MCKPEIIFKNPYNDTYRVAPLGYAWSVLFFGFFVPLCRKDWYGFGLMFIITLATLGFASPIYALFYNTDYAQRLSRKGYKVFHIKGNISPQTFRKLTCC